MAVSQPTIPTPPRVEPVITDGDIGLFPDTSGYGDTLFIPGDVQCDTGLQTAVYTSLFTNAPADGLTDRGGWWGDHLDEYGPLGSKLWTLQREKMLTGITETAKQYCIDALKWITDTGLATSFDVTVTRSGLYSLEIAVTIHRPNTAPDYYKYAYNWTAQQTNGY